MYDELNALFEFIRFSAALRNVVRGNNATVDRRESTAEHSWHLALMAWTLHSAFEREFNVTISQERLIKMCLVHDLVEIVVGDVPVWNLVEREAIALQEEAAAQQIFATLPASLGAEMLSLWHEFEQGETLEAKIARGIDRINPALMRMLTNQGWHEVNVDAPQLDRMQLPRIEFSEVLKALYDSIKAEAFAKGLLKP